MHYLELIKLLLEINFVLVISSLPAPVELLITPVDDHVKMRSILQLINGISKVLQKLHKYFNGTIISTSSVLLSAGVFPVIFILDLNDLENVKFYYLAHLCTIVINFQMSLALSISILLI